MLRNCRNCRNLHWPGRTTARESRLKSFQKRKLRPEDRQLWCSAPGVAICNTPRASRKCCRPCAAEWSAPPRWTGQGRCS